MTTKNQFYKCNSCGILVDVLETGGGSLVCCGKEMILMEEKNQKQEGKEKHVPIISLDEGVFVKVGSTPHPMEENHYIEVIQLLKDGEVIVEKKLKPGDEPRANFCCIKKTDGISARVLCNIHGLWVS